MRAEELLSDTPPRLVMVKQEATARLVGGSATIVVVWAAACRVASRCKRIDRSLVADPRLHVSPDRGGRPGMTVVMKN
jgi:hypothetical protein